MRRHTLQRHATGHPLRSSALLGPIAAILLPGLALGLSSAAQPPAPDDVAWRTLAAVRDSLTAAGPTRASFTQTFIPAGFSTGDRETGTLSLQLPDCLRWDYAEPYPKAFLLCGASAHLWNPEDGTGRRYAVDRETEPGLDLVLLGIEELKDRYRIVSDGTGEEPDATADDGGRGKNLLSIHLTPLADSGPITGATLQVDPETNRLTGLSYTDDEGNLTRFEIEGYRPLDEDGVFSPPQDIDWTEEEP